MYINEKRISDLIERGTVRMTRSEWRRQKAAREVTRRRSLGIWAHCEEGATRG